jgi:hypothetical protein
MAEFTKIKQEVCRGQMIDLGQLIGAADRG